MEGNSAYGGTIMDQEKFQSVTYVQGEGRVMLEANKPQFRKMTTLLDQDEYFEVEKAKEKLDINLPIQIGYSTRNYACSNFITTTWTCTSTEPILRTVRWIQTRHTWPCRTHVRFRRQT